jgi:hypothetical protein
MNPTRREDIMSPQYLTSRLNTPEDEEFFSPQHSTVKKNRCHSAKRMYMSPSHRDSQSKKVVDRFDTYNDIYQDNK